MYKVFNNLQEIILADESEISDFLGKNVIMISDFSMLRNIIENHVFSENIENIILISKDSRALQESFESHFQCRIAGGGWVFDEKARLLMIKRHKIWDIPKGHLEKGESIEECSIRELEEETGIENLKVISYLGISRHIFIEKGKWILKICHWYKMTSDFRGEFIPQTKEGITKCLWVKGSEVKIKLKKAWPSLYSFYEDFLISDIKK